MDSQGDFTEFDHLLQNSFVLESLRDTLDQMVEGFYMRKDTSEEIIKEASRQFHNVLRSNRYLLPKTFAFGQLAQYNYFNNIWTLNIKDPLVYLSYSPSCSPDLNYPQYFEEGDEEGYTPRNRTNLSKDISKNLNPSNSTMHCFKGYLKIMAFEETE